MQIKFIDFKTLHNPKLSFFTAKDIGVLESETQAIVCIDGYKCETQSQPANEIYELIPISQ